MQPNTPLPHNIDLTPNAGNSTLEADDPTDALSEASIQQQQTNTPPSFHFLHRSLRHSLEQ